MGIKFTDNKINPNDKIYWKLNQCNSKSKLFVTPSETEGEDGTTVDGVLSMDIVGQIQLDRNTGKLDILAKNNVPYDENSDKTQREQAYEYMMGYLTDAEAIIE